MCVLTTRGMLINPICILCRTVRGTGAVICGFLATIMLWLA